MFKILILTVLAISVKAEYDFSEILGEHYPVVSYPKGTFHPPCEVFNIKTDDSVKCDCGDAVNSAVIDFHRENLSFVVPVIFIEKTEDFVSKFNNKCNCTEDYVTYLLVRKIDANYFVTYAAKPDDNDPEKKEYFTNVFARKLPKLSELQPILNSVPDLLGKEPEHVCNLSV